METSAPEAVDFSKETAATKELYGLNDEDAKEYGERAAARPSSGRARRSLHSGCLGAVGESRRPIADGRTWDAHSKLEQNHGAHTRAVDKPIGGLLTDLAARGLLDDTLVVWTSEFGRTSYGQSGDGRDHNPWGYTQWLAGGGLKHGFTYGQTDEIGLKTVENPVDTYDVHATVLQLLGLDHLKTTFLHSGRSERPTVVYGKVVKDILA